MKKSSALLDLEKKLDKPSEDKQRVLNKFLLKPDMNVKQIGKSSLLQSLPSFIKDFGDNNQKLLLQ